MTPDEVVRGLADLFASEGMKDYLGEPVSQAAHMLQTAALAEAGGANGALVAAALLHDVGHFTGVVARQDLMHGTVVGGGVLGVAHTPPRHGGAGTRWCSWSGRRERGASVRNFGLIWVSGRAAGPELSLALRARARWEDLAAGIPGWPGRPGRPLAQQAGARLTLDLQSRGSHNGLKIRPLDQEAQRGP
jgi:hypothetical protein